MPVQPARTSTKPTTEPTTEPTVIGQDVVELRVHGVSGTPPTELLDTPLVDQVAGDGQAGFYRPRLATERHDPRDGLADPALLRRPVLEGYAWGGLTSGAPSRALWLILLPFTLTNVAPRLRPPGASDGGAVRLLWWISRMLALSMTVLIVLAACGVGIDLFGWQCGQNGACRQKGTTSSWVYALTGLGLEQRLALGTVAPVLLLIGLWFISGRTVNAYEKVHDQVTAAPVNGGDEVEPGLRSAWMWRNQEQVRRLSMLHFQAGLTAVLCTLVGPFEGAGWIRLVLGGAMTGYAAVLFVLPWFGGREEHPTFRILQRVLLGALAAGIAACVVVLLIGSPLASTPAYDGGAAATTGLPGYSQALLTVFCTQLVFLAAFVLLVVVWGWNATPTGAARSLHDTTASLFAVLAVFFGAIFSSGMYVFVGTYLTAGQVRPDFGKVTAFADQFDVPQIVRDANIAFAFSVALLAVAVVVGALYLLARRVLSLPPRLDYEKELAASYEKADLETDTDGSRRATLTGLIGRSRLVDHAQWLVLWLVVAGSLISLVMILFLANATWGWSLPSNWVTWHERRGTGCTDDRCGFTSAHSLQASGALLTILFVLLLVGLGAAAFRVEKTRRSVGILWDLASFWPRAAHPYASPCYAERGVPDLITRVHQHQAAGWPVILAAHSQGTVLSVAVLEQCHGRGIPVFGRLTFLTFGCVVRRLYEKFFPAYFSPQVVDDRGAELAKGAHKGWVNLWRSTDYLGGQLVHDAPPDPACSGNDHVREVSCCDPLWQRRPGDTQLPRADRHSNYWRAAEYTGAVQYLQAALRGTGGDPDVERIEPPGTG